MFYPQPKDIIVCRNGQRFVCVNEEDYVYKEDHRDNAIYGHHETKGTLSHMCWKSNDGKVCNCDEYDIVKIIPNSEISYTIDDIISTLDALKIDYPSKEAITNTLSNVKDPEYAKYLELKKKFGE